MDKPAPHGSTQTPIDARFKREGGGKAAATTATATTATTAAAGEETEAPAPAAAPQPQDVEPEDAEQVQRELWRLTREVSEHLPHAEPAPVPRRREDEDKAAKEAERQQAFEDTAVGAADAGAAAVELAERAVQGALSAAARKLGLGQKEEA
jgi:hypothetical protein